MPNLLSSPLAVLRLATLLLCFALGGPPLSAQTHHHGGGREVTRPEATEGLLVMAHGGGAEWNVAVASAVEPLRARLPTALAFGMADPATLQAGLDSLAARGVGRVAVVRLFMSGASFLHQTEYLLGLRGDPPAEPLIHGAGGHADHGGHAGSHDGGLHPVSHRMEILVSAQGLGESDVAGEILVDRARRLSRDLARERVMLLAHGMGDEAENAEVLASMGEPAERLRALGFPSVQAATLREDWPEVRRQAESEIRAWVGEGSRQGRRTLVVPFRLSGFGPYAEVLEGLSYEASEGLLPHPLVTRWIEEEAAALLCARDGSVGGDACRTRIQGR